MIFGLTTATYTLIHVVLSLVGIGSGLAVMFGLLAGKRLDGWIAVFLATTVATSLTGFGFPIEHFTPAIALGILSMIVLTIAIVGRYTFHLSGTWRRTFVICAVIALYFNVFVAIAQSFQKVPALKALAPTQSEPPFAVAQLVCIALFIWLGIAVAKRFRDTPARTI